MSRILFKIWLKGLKIISVNGVFEDWSEWEQCSLSCGGGHHNRSRSCIGPFHGGEPCDGEFSQTKLCNEHPCPSEWLELAKTIILHNTFFINNNNESELVYFNLYFLNWQDFQNYRITTISTISRNNLVKNVLQESVVII